MPRPRVAAHRLADLPDGTGELGLGAGCTGQEFLGVYLAVKRAEYRQFMGEVGEQDWRWYLLRREPAGPHPCGASRERS
jgi:hypothetical protein